MRRRAGDRARRSATRRTSCALDPAQPMCKRTAADGMMGGGLKHEGARRIEIVQRSQVIEFMFVALVLFLLHLEDCRNSLMRAPLDIVGSSR